MNVELLERIKSVIREEPRRFNMLDWIVTTRPDLVHVRKLRDTALEQAQDPPCGTVACIAGWAALISKFDGDVKKFDLFMDKQEHEADEASRNMEHDFEYVSVDAMARAALDIDYGQASKLFYVDHWYWEDSGDRYRAALDLRQFSVAAEIACAYIDAFIAHDGWPRPATWYLGGDDDNTDYDVNDDEDDFDTDGIELLDEDEAKDEDA